jgi:hypothetical protein
MTLTSEITTDSPAARRFRLLAPLVAVLALAALFVAPGIIGELGDDATPAAPAASDHRSLQSRSAS